MNTIKNALCCLILVVLALLSGACEEPTEPTLPTVSSFAVNGGASSTTSRTVALNNTCTGAPTHYMASQSASFTGASWQAYSAAPSFELSAGGGAKTVYFKVKNASGTSTTASDSITLNLILVPDVVEMTQAAAETSITNAGLTVGTVTEEYSDTVPEGEVISQNPISGTSVASGTPVALVISGGVSAVKADFSVDKPNGVAPLTVQFTDLSEAIDGDVSSWEWDFGDGVTSTQSNPSHTYFLPGEFTVTLYASGASGEDTITYTEAVIVDAGEDALIGIGGGSLYTPNGGGIQIAPGVLSGDALFRVADTGDLAIRSTLADVVPYAGSTTVNTEESALKVALETDFSMTVTIALSEPMTPGTELDVYRKGDVLGFWTLLDVKATVDAGGQTASFETDQPGTYIVRETDEYTIPTIDLDEIYSENKSDLPPPSQPSLSKIAGSGPIPIVLVHGAGSYKVPGARWDNFVSWAQQNMDLQNRYQLWRFLHDSDGHPVGFDIDATYNSKKNNARELAEEIERARDENGFPGSEQQFIIVAHSRGGLVARAFMENWPGGGDQVLAALTLATPHHGSPFAIPDWTYDTIKTSCSLPINFFGTPILNPGHSAMVALSRYFDWKKPGDADLAWDNFDAADPLAIGSGTFGVPYEPFKLNTWLAGVFESDHIVSPNDAGWSFAEAEDSDYHLPSGYTRNPGATLWNMTQGDTYTDKLLMYGGYITSAPSSWNSLVENEGLFFLNVLLQKYASHDQTIPHFVSNDGMVPLQSALFLESSSTEPIYTITDNRATFIEFNERLRVPVNHVRYQEFEGYNHLDMVQGRKSNTNATDDTDLFEYIEQDLDAAVAAMPVADFEISSQSGLTVTIDASASHDRNTTMWPATGLEYRVNWDANGSSQWSAWSASPNLTNPYALPGTYTVIIEVRDQDGMIVRSVSQQVTVEGNVTEQTVMLPGNVPLVMVWIPGGTYMMGRYPGEQDSASNEDPQHQVSVPGFWMAKYELTKRQWQAVMGTTPWGSNNNVPDSAAQSISWNNAKAFITALNDYMGITFRLPSEAEWEYACRAGTATRFHWGDDPSYTIGDAYCWWAYNARDMGEGYVHAVGQKLPNVFGLYDMSGNVNEWCEDDWHGSYTGAPTNGSAWIGNPRALNHVLRGGSWTVSGDGCRSAVRWGVNEDSEDLFGFRLAATSLTTPEPQTETIMLPGDVPLEMVRIPAGTFMMGRYPGEQPSYSDEDPQHQVSVPGVWMAKYELTKRQWQAVMGTTPWSGQSYILNDLDSPAVCVSWNDAKTFITALNSYTGLTFRLPSEAEWEYACRAGTTTRFYWGDDPYYTQIRNYAWYLDNAYNEEYAHVVGQKQPNAFGLYDMIGNVWEWCEDDWHGSYTGAPTNGSAWVYNPRGSLRMLRGGGWYFYGYVCRSACRRHDYGPSNADYAVGFRLSR